MEIPRRARWDRVSKPPNGVENGPDTTVRSVKRPAGMSQLGNGGFHKCLGHVGYRMFEMEIDIEIIRLNV